MIKDWTNDQITGNSVFITCGGLLGSWWFFYYKHWPIVYDGDHLGLMFLLLLSVIYCFIASVAMIGTMFEMIRDHQKRIAAGGKGHSKLPWLVSLGLVAYAVYKTYH